MVFSGLPGGLLLLAASVEDFPERLPYPFGGSFADLARSFSGADADVLAGSRSAFAEISAGFARVQSSEITGRSGSALAQARRSLGCAFANVLTPFAHILARAGPSFVLIVLRLVLRPGLRLGGFLILRWVAGRAKAGRLKKTETHVATKIEPNWGLAFISFLLLMDSNDNHFIRWFDASKSGRLHAKPLSEVCAIFLN
jgi:hypothetical protein